MTSQVQTNSPETKESSGMVESLYPLFFGGRVHTVSEDIFNLLNALHLKAYGVKIPTRVGDK